MEGCLMTRDETKKTLLVIQAAYPSFTPKSEAEASIRINTWHMMLEEFEYDQVITATKAYISSEVYPPVPASIIQKLQQIRELSSDETSMNEMQVWALVRNAVSDGFYKPQQAYDSLPESIQKAVGSPQTLKEWFLTDKNTFETVIQSNFFKSYRATIQRQKEISMLPLEIRNKLALAKSDQVGQITKNETK